MKQSLTSSKYSKAQSSGDIPYAKIEEHGSGEILAEEIEKARQIRILTGLERFCDRYHGSEYCLTRCEYRGECNGRR